MSNIVILTTLIKSTIEKSPSELDYLLNFWSSVAQPNIVISLQVTGPTILKSLDDILLSFCRHLEQWIG